MDLRDPSAAQLEELRRAWLDHMVLVFRDQQLEREHHEDFGSLHVHPLNQARSGDPEIPGKR